METYLVEIETLQGNKIYRQEFEIEAKCETEAACLVSVYRSRDNNVTYWRI